MALRYSVGDKVVVSRAETGEDHEPGVVVDSYELLVGDDRKPMVVVEFRDGDRQYIAATTPNVLPVEEEEEELEGDEAAAAEADDAETEAEAESEAGEDDGELFVDDDEGASP